MAGQVRRGRPPLSEPARAALRLGIAHEAVRLFRLQSIMWLRMLWSTGAPPEMRS